METMLQDVKYAFRQLGRDRAFSVLAVLTLALGIGVSTALFSVIDAALLRPLPYPHPKELITLDVEETSDGTPSRFSAEMLDRRGSGTPVIARLRPGVTLAHAGRRSTR